MTDKNMAKLFKKAVPLLVALFVLGALCGILLVGPSALTDFFQSEETTTQAPEETSQEPISLGSVSARFMCAGDNLIHNVIYQQAASRSATGGYDFTFAYEKIAPVLKLSDFAILNQETVISKSNEPSSYPLFNSPAELGEHMVKLGFNVINHANNHVLDQGAAGASETIEFWKSQSGVILTGLYSDETDMNTVKTNTVNGITFSHLGFTEYLNGLSLPADSALKIVSPVSAGLTKDTFFATMKAMVENAKASSDVVCVSVHFQQENNTTPSASQEEIVNALVSYGADVIIGTGSHVLQPIKYVERTDGTRALVIYSLGNFISAQDSAANMVSAIADITVEKNLDTNTTTVKSAGLIPIVTHYGSNFTNLHIEPFYTYTAELADLHGIKDPSFSYEYITNLLNSVVTSEFIISDPFAVVEEVTEAPIAQPSDTTQEQAA